jgi:superfamily II DNA or RNA helicase
MRSVGNDLQSKDGWSVGQHIRVRGEVWAIVERTRFDDCSALRLSGVGAANAGTVRTVLVPFDRPERLHRPSSMRVVRARRWLHAARCVALEAHPFGSLSAAVQARIQILPYQLEPALGMLRHGVTRLLIADGVGLGKTIQAGLLLSELAARHDAFRALVVAPAGLRDQWCRELAAHFGLASIPIDTPWLAGMARDLPGDVNPWMLPGIAVASFDLLKRPEVLRPLEDVSWDLLVVDEAHGAALGTQRRAAVHAIGLRSRRIVLLTATPHPGEPDEFDALCRIGAIDARTDRIVIFSRTRADVHLSQPRRSSLMGVRLSAPERRMHRLLVRYTDAVSREAIARGDKHARLAAVVLRKRALSSAASLAVSVTRRLALLSGVVADSARQLQLPLGDDIVEDDAPDTVLGAPGLTDAAVERRWLAEIAEAAARAAARESKVRFLLRFLARLREPAIVFTEYRDTLARLQAAVVGTGREVILLHGGLTAAERSAAQRTFNEHGGLLLATDAAAEGLNLHGRCRTIVHFELPWSPVRLQQRAGRVDRIGQECTVHEIGLVANDTAERLVLAPLARRVARARGAPGEPSGALLLFAESRVACAVMDGQPLPEIPSDNCVNPLSHTADPPAALHAEAEAEAIRLLRHRAWSGSQPRDAHGAGSDSCCVTVVRIRRSSLSRGLTALFSIRLAADDGWTAHREVAAVTIPCDVRLPHRSVAVIRAVAREWLRRFEPALRSAATSGAALRLEEAARKYADCQDALDRRERAMAAALSSAAQQIVQAGLFDHRALRHAAERRRATAALLDESKRRSSALETRRLMPRVELVAVLLTVPR